MQKKNGEKGSADDILVVWVTAPEEVALELARKLVGERLAACVQVFPSMTSVYRWEGAIQEDPERLVQIKTTRERYQALQEFVVANHPYSVPEVLAFPATQGLEAYLQWVRDSVALSPDGRPPAVPPCVA